MDFGNYTVIIDDENGQRSVTLNAEVRAPVEGEWVDIDDRWYVIKLGTHPRSGNVARGKKAGPQTRGLVLYAVPVGPVGADEPSPPRGGGGGSPDRGPSDAGTLSDGRNNGPALRVLPFEPPQTSACSYLPAWLTLALVASGYEAQSRIFESAKFASWKLIHSGSHWFLEKMINRSADELRALSREALFHFRQAESFVLHEWPVLAASSDPSSNVFDLTSYRKIKKASGLGGND